MQKILNFKVINKKIIQKNPVPVPRIPDYTRRRAAFSGRAPESSRSMMPFKRSKNDYRLISNCVVNVLFGTTLELLKITYPKITLMFELKAQDRPRLSDPYQFFPEA